MAKSFLTRVALLSGVSMLVLGASGAHAQSVNYGELEQMFGEPVTTSATGKPQKVSDVPVDMDIITQDDIRRSGADNIPDILNFVTGINVRRYGFADASVSVRGMNSPQSPRLLVLLNGRQVYQDDYGFVAWQTIPVELDEIRQIEVVKGPNSALFGFNAVGGVVNIITYDPLQDTVNVITGRTGTQSLAEGSVVSTVHAFDKAGLRISAGGYTADEFSDTPPGGPNPVSPIRGSINADSHVIVTPGVELTLSASSTDASNHGAGSDGAFYNEFFRVNSVQAGGSADTGIGTLRLNAYHNELHMSYGSASSWLNDVDVVQLSDLAKLGTDHTVRLGLEYRDNSIASQFNQPLFGGRAGYDVYSGSAMWNWDITPKVALTNAARLDYVTLNHPGTVLPASGFTQSSYNNRSFDAVSYNSGLVYKITDSDTVRLTAARGVQMPSLLDLALQIPAGSLVISGNPNLMPAIVSNYELGYDRSLDSISSTAHADVFYERTDNVTAPAGSGPISFVNGQLLEIANNIGYSVETGLELGIRGHSESGFRWNASYALASVSDHLTVNKGPVPTVNVNYQDGTPVNAIIVGGGYSVGKWEFDAQAKWQSSFLDYRSAGAYLVPVPVSNFITANARVGFRVTDQITTALVVQQINQNRIVETSGPPVERRIIASLTARF